MSANLHHWIDLIFGYKQRGQAAVDANNVFFHLTYGGAVNWKALKDPRERIAIEDQIRHFGQMPAQLLRTPHAQRKPRLLRPGGLLGAGLSIGSGEEWITGRASKFSMHVLPLYLEPIVCIAAMIRSENVSPEQLATGPVSAIPAGLKRFVTIGTNRAASVHSWSPTAELGSVPHIDSDPNVSSRAPIGVPLARDVTCSWRLYAVSPWAMVSVGHYDNSLVVSAMDSTHGNPTQTQALFGHKDLVTCVDMDGESIVTGSRDTTLQLWQVASGADGALRFRVAERPKGVYYGHHTEVSCVCISERLDLVVSGSRDGSVLVHELRSCRLIRELRPPNPDAASSDVSIGVIRITWRGDVFVYSNAHIMFVYSLNGALLAKDESVRDDVSCALVTRNGEYVILGSLNCCIAVRTLVDLQSVHRIKTQAPVHTLTITPDEFNIVGGLADGKICVVTGEYPNKKKGTEVK